MLSYQHAFHAGNLADVHKHALLAVALDYLTRKDKPLSYIETHAGRGMYDLSGPQAQKTGEASAGIESLRAAFPAQHPYRKAVEAVRAQHGAAAYPGSPALARHLLRETDTLHLAELHPQEFGALRRSFRGHAKTYRQDGFELAHALCPPMPRRGLLLIDPPYEVKTDYTAIPGHIAKIHRAWNVGGVMLWYPILSSGAERGMLTALRGAYPDAFQSEVRFAPARPGHGMIGSGLFALNAPFGLKEEADRLAHLFSQHAPPAKG